MLTIDKVDAFILAARSEKKGHKEMRAAIRKAIIRSLAEDQKYKTYSLQIHITMQERTSFDHASTV